MSSKTKELDTVDIVAAAYNRLEQAEEALDKLQTEARDNASAMTAASAAHDSTTYFRLQKRQLELATEQHFAKSQVLLARIVVEEQRLEKATAELIPLRAAAQAIIDRMAPLQAELAGVNYQIAQRENVKRNHATTKWPLVRDLENLEGAWQRRVQVDAAPAIKSLQGFAR